MILLKKLPIFLPLLFCLYCSSEQKPAVLTFEFIEEFPQDVIITRFTDQFVHQIDTFHMESKEDRSIVLEVDRPQYLYVLFHDRKEKFFTQPGSKLRISRFDDRYEFEGELKRENYFIFQIPDNLELKNKVWDYKSPLIEFKEEVADYFAYKKKVLSDTFPEKEDNFFYRLNLIEDRAMQNSVVLQHINKNSEYSIQNSLFYESIDTGLFDFKKMSRFLDAANLRSFYSKMGTQYYMMKKFGSKFHDLRIEEKYLLRGEVISEKFPQPIRSVLMYDDLKYYPLEYDHIPDSMDLPSPRELLDRYEESLLPEAYAFLVKEFDKWEEAIFAYVDGQMIPVFDFKSKLNTSYTLSPETFGSSVLIDVWASWCGPCIQSFPTVVELQNRHRDNLEVISVSIDQKIDLFKKGLSEYEVPGKLQLYAEHGFNSDFAEFFQIKGIPRYILIGKDGRIIDGNINLLDVSAKLLDQ